MFHLKPVITLEIIPQARTASYPKGFLPPHYQPTEGFTISKKSPDIILFLKNFLKKTLILKNSNETVLITGIEGNDISQVEI